jgi:hypothetical protein
MRRSAVVQTIKADGPATELQITLGQNAVINLVDDQGQDLGGGLYVEVRSTKSGAVEIYIHSPELCADGCEPFVQAFIGDAKAEEERKEADQAKANFSAFAESLAKELGITDMPVYVLDEHGIRPLNPKKGD